MGKENYVRRAAEESIGLPRKSLQDIKLSGNEIDIISSHFSGSEINSHHLQPVVDDVMDSILGRIMSRSRELEVPFIMKEKWPNGKRFAAAITHDADRIEAPSSHIRKVKDRFSEDVLSQALTGKLNPYWNVDRMASIERDSNIRSSFYLLVGEYDLSEKIQKLKHLINNGWEIGLHGAIGTDENSEEMEEQIRLFRKILDFNPRGIRQHYLKFTPKRTWAVMENLGIFYDSTWGYREQPGFKAGTSLPFHPPSADWETMNIIEVPLILMDTSLWGYMHLTEESGLELIDRLLSETKRRGGLFTLLWHQEALLMRGGRLYQDIIKRISSEDCFTGSALMIAEWWKQRIETNIELNKTDSDWEIRVMGAPSGLHLNLDNGVRRRVKVDGNCRIVSSDNNTTKLDVSGDCLIRLIS